MPLISQVLRQCLGHTVIVFCGRENSVLKYDFTCFAMPGVFTQTNLKIAGFLDPLNPFHLHLISKPFFSGEKGQ